MQLGCGFTWKAFLSFIRLAYVCMIPSLWPVPCCLFTPGLYWYGMGRSIGSTGLRWAIFLCYNFSTSREDQMFIQAISSGFKSNPTTLLFWKGLDAFTMSDTAEKQMEVVSLPFPTVSCDLPGMTLWQCDCKCNWYVNTVFFRYEHNMMEFIFKSLTSQCHRCAPCAASHYSNRRCLLQNWTLTNIPVFILGTEAWIKLYGSVI